MSRTFSTKSSKLSISGYRQATIQDIEEIGHLVTPATEFFFGNADVDYKIKTCFYSLVALNEFDSICAAVCLDYFPNVPTLKQSEWEFWINKLYKLDTVNAQNSLFIHLLVYDTDYTYMFLKPLLTELFIRLTRTLHILCVVPGNFTPADIMEEYFTVIMPAGYYNPKKVQTIFLTFRYHYMHKYKIRLAVEEDNDDIVPLVDKHCKLLKELYGEFYVSEILTKHPEMRRQLIVAEYAEEVVAVLFLNEDVCYPTLIDSFCIEPFLSEIEDNLGLSRYYSDKSLVSLLDAAVPFTMSALEIHSNRKLLRELTGTGPAVEEGSRDSSAESLDIKRALLKSSADMVYELREIYSPLEMLSLHESVASGEDDQDYLDLYELEMMKDMENYHAQQTDIASKHMKILEKLDTCFTLEIIAACARHEETVMNDILEASFQCYDEKNYLLFTMPHIYSHFPALDYFSKVVPRRSSIYPHQLFLLHKNAVNSRLTVRKLRKHEYYDIEDFLVNVNKAEVVYKDIQKSLHQNDGNWKSYVFLNGKVIIGVIVISLETDIDYYYAYYKMYRYVDRKVHRYNKFGVIQHCIFSPLFQKQAQYLIREVHRLSDMSILVYKLHKSDILQITRKKPLTGLLKELIPVPLRKLPVYEKLILKYIEIPESLKESKWETFALYISTPKLTSLPRIQVNARLVVVGASNTSYSFLETLIFQFEPDKHVDYNNVTVIYEGGLKDKTGLTKYTTMLFTHTGRYEPVHLCSCFYRTHVNYINGTLTGIDRKNKYVTINNDNILPYDYLFLFCGQQYHHPFERGIVEASDAIKCPFNIFIINKYKDADAAFENLKQIIDNKESYTIIIYGVTIDVYICIATLQKLRIPMENLIYVEPYPDRTERPSLTCFNNPEIYQAVHYIIDTNNIKCYRGYYFEEWLYDPDTKHVTMVQIRSKKEKIQLDCDAMFFYSKKEVDFKTFTAVNTCGLVYDGRLVIGPECQTNDEFIYAAGPCTKYSRKYFADRYNHMYYDSYEIGERLAKQIRAKLLPGGLTKNKGDPIFENLKQENLDKIVPQFTRPVILFCILPGNINYFEMRSPGKQVPLEAAAHEVDFGRVFITGNLHIENLDLDRDPEYFRLYLDNHDGVAGITCFTRREIDNKNLVNLWGKHEKVLNNLIWRFEMNLIPNFYEYFKNPYFAALYIDTFEDLQDNLNIVMNLLTSIPGTSLIEDLYQRFRRNDWTKLSEQQESEVVNTFNRSMYHNLLVERLVKFIENNCTYLPMYIHPLLLKVILHNYEDSLLFSE